MNGLIEAIRELRIRALSQIARLKGIKSEEKVVRNIVDSMSDSDIIRELRIRQSSLRWFWKMFDWH